MSSRIQGLSVVAVTLLAVASFLVLARFHAVQIGDDAFIYFRYARNLLRGWGPVFNRGEAVEGFSSPLWLGVVTG